MSNPIKTCPHCQSTELFTATVQGEGLPGSLLPLGALHGPRYENLICARCGLTQWFVSPEHLHLIGQKLKPAQ